MKKLTYLLPVLLLIALGACGGGEGADTPADTTGAAQATGAMQGAPPAAPAEEPALPEMENGYQVLHVQASVLGFEPRTIRLRPGVPARLVFTRTDDNECMEKVQIPAFGVEQTDLPLNEPVTIEFTPDEGGEFTFTCGMEMQTGTIVVRA